MRDTATIFSPARWIRAFRLFDKEGEGGSGGGSGVIADAAAGNAGAGGGDAGTGQDGQSPDGQTQGTTPPAGEEGAVDGNADGAGEPQIPETYEFALTGVELSEDVQSLYNSTFRELGLTQEQVGQLMETEQKAAEAMDQQRSQAREEQMSQWLDAAKGDRELGQDWDGTLRHVAAGLQAAQFSKEDIEMFDATGLTNHPGMIRAFARLGQLLGDDSAPNTQPASPETPSEEKWYGGSTPKTKRG